MAAPTPPNFNRYTGLDANVPVIPPDNQTITYPSDLGSIQTINGVSYGIQIIAYKYKSSTNTINDFYAGIIGGLTGAALTAFAGGILSGGIRTGLLRGLGFNNTLNLLNNNTQPTQEQIEQALTQDRNNLNQGNNNQTQRFLGPTLGTVNLQLPVKINDAHTLAWSQESTKAIFDFTGLVRIADVLQAPSGVTINPGLFMMFHHPNFKTIDMTWQFAAHNQQESFAIANIINFFKYHSSPERNNAGLSMNYPSMFTLKLFPNDLFTFRIKPCIIESVATDFTPAGYPSFNRNGSPVSVNMGIRFKEIDIWEKNTWNQTVV